MLDRHEDVLTIEDRIRELGLELPAVAQALAVYVPAVQTGRFVQTSGQLPLSFGSLLKTGKVGAQAGSVTPADAAALAAHCVLNGLAAIKAVIGSLDRIEQIVKVTGFVASDPTFTQQHLVLNGASELLGTIFGNRGTHARSAVGVAVLPLDAPVEVELLVAIKDPYSGNRHLEN